MTVKAGADEVGAERDSGGAQRVAAEAVAGPLGRAEAGAESEARTGPSRRGANTAESEKKVTRGGEK